MENKKLRVVYFWADEHIMLDDFLRGYSARMTDWANRFFKTYEFELSVEPSAADRTSVPRASKYALRKTGGTRPDWRSVAKATEEENAEIAVLDQQLAVADEKRVEVARRVEAAKRRLRAHEAESSRLLTALLNATSAAFAGILADLKDSDRRVAAAAAVADAAEADLSRLDAERDRIRDQRTAVHRRLIANLDSLSAYENVFRAQMAEAFRNHKIGSRNAVNVIFCRAAGMLSMRKEKYRTMGETQPLASSTIVSLKTMKPVWPHPFVLIDLNSTRHTLAHELVHVAGHSHPPDRMIRVLEKRISGLTLPKTVGPGAKPSLVRGVEYVYEDVERFEVVPGGYYDGAENDIMRYRNDDPEPDKLILNKDDLELMNKAYFKEP